MKDILDKILLSNNVVEDFNLNYSKPEFKAWIDSILPEVEKCKNLKQDNPWHIYNCLDHILHSVEEINKQTTNLSYEDRRMLAYTMFFHDIGKPQCYSRRYSKLYKREVDSFFKHNEASVVIANRVLNSFGFTKEEQQKILKLVEKHDIFMFIKLADTNNQYHRVLSNEVIEQEIESLNTVGDGEELLNFLIKVGRADNLAQNPEMTKESLEMLDIMDDMLEARKAKEDKV